MVAPKASSLSCSTLAPQVDCFHQPPDHSPDHLCFQTLSSLAWCSTSLLWGTLTLFFRAGLLNPRTTPWNNFSPQRGQPHGPSPEYPQLCAVLQHLIESNIMQSSACDSAVDFLYLYRSLHIVWGSLVIVSPGVALVTVQHLSLCPHSLLEFLPALQGSPLVYFEGSSTCKYQCLALDKVGCCETTLQTLLGHPQSSTVILCLVASRSSYVTQLLLTVNLNFQLVFCGV
jgi:hypothetical protein